MTPHVPHLSPEWPPTDDQLAETARGVHWEVEQVAYDFAHRPHLMTTDRRRKIAADLRVFAKMMDGEGEAR